MAREKNKANFELLKWKVLVCGQESPRRFQRAMEASSGWTSEIRTQFPIDIILAFPKPVNVWKFVINCAEDKQPKRIEVRFGSSTSSKPNPDKDEDGPTYTDAKNAKYQKHSLLTFEAKPKKERVQEEKILFMDVISQFVWIILDGPHEGKTIQIKQLQIFGYSNIHSSDEDSVKRKKEQKEIDEEEKRGLNPTPQNDMDKDEESIAKLAALLSEGDNDKDDNYKIQKIPYSSDGDSLKQSEDKLGSEPLTSVRTIKNVLKEKMAKANANDKIIEATACRRGIERLEEYDERIVELKKKMSSALQHNDFDYAERYRLAMIDCRDTVFRAIHLDLLLNSEELRSLGAESKWSESGEKTRK